MYIYSLLQVIMFRYPFKPPMNCYVSRARIGNPPNFCPLSLSLSPSVCLSWKNEYQVQRSLMSTCSLSVINKRSFASFSSSLLFYFTYIPAHYCYMYTTVHNLYVESVWDTIYEYIYFLVNVIISIIISNYVDVRRHSSSLITPS